ncbi:hypothetical protein [Paracoccus marcusii]|uniref:hypothetical protein n=1 Tax=Paracoccus marcusii TaxID=59779 RepID=UPI003265A839
MTRGTLHGHEDHPLGHRAAAPGAEGIAGRRAPSRQDRNVGPGASGLNDQGQFRILEAIAHVACLTDGRSSRFDPAQGCDRRAERITRSPDDGQNLQGHLGRPGILFHRRAAGETQHHPLRGDALTFNPDRGGSLQKARLHPPQCSHGGVSQENALNPRSLGLGTQKKRSDIHLITDDYAAERLA